MLAKAIRNLKYGFVCLVSAATLIAVVILMPSVAIAIATIALDAVVICISLLFFWL